MNKSTAEIWRSVFARWPESFRRKGVLVPSFGEPIPFSDFVMDSDLLIIERPTPDSVGARRVAIPLSFIEGLKYTEPLKTQQFLEAGYTKGVKSTASGNAQSKSPAQTIGSANAVEQGGQAVAQLSAE